jgi:hypothetical protein
LIHVNLVYYYTFNYTLYMYQRKHYSVISGVGAS